ncbi:MAG: 8-oxo-dGTP diphosphatase [Cocleimonas sp.]|jgi:8-oxo-dGTP diphosphatase
MTEIIRVASYAVIINDGHILLCRLVKTLPSHNGEWTLPGGGMDFGEHPEQTMVRETMEETGLNVALIKILGIDTLREDNLETKKKWHSIRMVYEAEYLGGDLKYELKGSTDKCEWHLLSSISDLPTVSLVEAALAMRVSAQI